VFHIIIASILLPGWLPYFLAFLATFLMGEILFLQHIGWIRAYPLAIPWNHVSGYPAAGYPLYLLGVTLALGSTLAITVYFTTALSRYVETVRAQVRQHRKMLGIGQLVAGFAHQISNPLDGLQNGLRQIGHGIRGNPSLEETVPKMLAALERIERVARRLQEFARPQGLELQECDVAKAVEATLALFEKTFAERKITLLKDLKPVPQAWGDPYSIEEIIFNLCNNAMDAMPQGGSLIVRTLGVDRPDIGSDGCIAIEVSDTGQGIPADRLEMIFEPFFTTKSKSGGTGLGLSLCRMLLSEMGAQIEVDSVPNKGSTFRILLTAASTKRAEPLRTATLAHGDPGRANPGGR
jgi:signal transduction histidine kinase